MAATLSRDTFLPCVSYVLIIAEIVLGVYIQHVYIYRNRKRKHQTMHTPPTFCASKLCILKVVATCVRARMQIQGVGWLGIWNKAWHDEERSVKSGSDMCCWFVWVVRHFIAERSLEVKLPTYGQMHQQWWERWAKRKRQKNRSLNERVSRKKIKRAKRYKSREMAPESPKISSPKRRVRSHVAGCSH